MKFSGNVGFWEGEEETIPGIWQPKLVERHYTGEMTQLSKAWQMSSNQQNDEYKLNMQISILSDLYARNNYDSISYVEWNGKKWKVTSITIKYPRINLTLGGKYNGERPVGTT